MIVGAQFFQTLIMFDITTARVGVIFIPQNKWREFHIHT